MKLVNLSILGILTKKRSGIPAPTDAREKTTAVVPCAPNQLVKSKDKTMLKTLILSTIAITTTAGSSIATGTLPPSQPSDPVTTIANRLCPVGPIAGPPHPYCVAQVAEGVDRDPRGGREIPRCAGTGPNIPGCTMFARVVPCPAPAPGRSGLPPVIAIEDGRHVPPGRNGAPKGTAGGGTRYGVLFQVPFAV